MTKRKNKKSKIQLYLTEESDIISLGGRKKMKTSVEATGKNIEQAIENALFELKAPREDVDIKIISEGGLFKKAKVVVSISQDEIQKYQKREKLKEEELKQEEIKPQPEKQQPKQKEEKPKKQPKIEQTQEKTEKQEKPAAQEKEQKISAVEFVDGLLKAFGKDGQISEIEEDGVIKIEVSGEGLNELIGYRGETMFALSYLMNTICKRESKKQILDICDYREKRAQSLASLANRMAAKVAKTGRYAKLEPMDASERRLIHLALQDNQKVTTMSKGTEPKRYVIIFPREYKE